MKRSQRFILSLATGVMLSLPWLGFPGWFLLFALIPLLLLEHFFTENKSRFGSVSFWGHAFLTFFIWNSITTWWIFFATPVGMALAIITNSLLMSLVWWLAHIARRYFKASLGYVALAAFWISFEYFHFHWDIEWPWLNLGNGFANNIKLVQWYEYTGILGGTVWVLAVNLILFSVYNQIRKMTDRRRFFAAVAGLFLLIVIPVVTSLVIFHNYTETVNPKEIVVVQPNIDPYSESYDAEAEQEKLQKFVALATEKTTPSTNFIVAPETLFENPRFWNENELSANIPLQQLRNFASATPSAGIVFGVSSYKTYPDENSAPPTARKNRDMIYDMFNSAFYTDASGKTEIYHKSILVVGVEKMPFKKVFGFLGDMIINIGGTSGSLGTQDEPENFTGPDGTKVAPVICYESVFGEYVSQYVRKGAQLIFIITNDGWWKNTPGYKQHLSFARLRAIETRRSIARSANTGISCFINQRGEISQATEWWVPASIKGNLNANSAITFYVKHGDYIARVAIFMSIVLLANLLVVKTTDRKKQTNQI